MRMSLRIGMVLSALASGCGAEDLETEEPTESWFASVESVPAPGPDHISFGSDTHERARGVRIGDHKHGAGKVIYSVRLHDLQASETLRLRGEVTLSRCNAKDIDGQSGDAGHTPCTNKHLQQSPYDYDPRFSATLVLAGSPDAASSGKAVSGWFDMNCSEAKHHCALAIPEVKVDHLPNAGERFLNLVVTADARGANARNWDVMEVEKGHGGLYVTRVGDGAGKVVFQEGNSKVRTPGKMGIDQTEDENDHTQVKQLVYQQRVDGLQAGDVVSASAKMHAELDGSPDCNPLITSRLVLTRNPDAKEPKQPEDLFLTAKNGANCTDHGNSGCRYDKSGAARVGKAGKGTMYVSLVAVALRSCAAPNGGDRWQVKPGGSIEVTVRR